MNMTVSTDKKVSADVKNLRKWKNIVAVEYVYTEKSPDVRTCERSEKNQKSTNAGSRFNSFGLRGWSFDESESKKMLQND